MLNWIIHEPPLAKTLNGDQRLLARARVLALQTFYMRLWSGPHARTSPRHASLAVLCLGVTLLVGWAWGLGIAGCAILAFGLERRAYLRIKRFLEHQQPCALPAADAATKGAIGALGTAMAVYVLPFTALATAPAPGPALGLLLGFGALLVVSGQHILTKRMAFLTLSIAAAPFLVNAWMLSQDWTRWVLTGLALLLAMNAFVLTRGAFHASRQTIEAWLEAERASETLEQKVRERTRELEDARLEAEKANLAKSAFLATISHELRTPLNAIIGYAELLEESADLGGRGQDLEDAQRLVRASHHLLSLINDVLDHSKIEAGRLEVRACPFPVADCLRQVCDTMQPMLLANGNRLELALDPDLGQANNDQLRFSQCLLNLLSNAGKFTKDGLVRLEGRRVREGGREWIEVEVHDTGIGMSPETLAKLFKPFSQADGSITRAYGGTGLGLCITRRLALAMGGEIGAASRLGHGSSFQLRIAAELDRARLPAASAAA